MIPVNPSSLGVDFHELRQNFVKAHFELSKCAMSTDPHSLDDDTLHVVYKGTCFSFSEYVIESIQTWMRNHPYLGVHEVMITASEFQGAWKWTGSVGIVVHISDDADARPILVINIINKEMARTIANSMKPDRVAETMARRMLHHPYDYADYVVEDMTGESGFSFDSETNPISSDEVYSNIVNCDF